jgi:hypothetical protein
MKLPDLHEDPNVCGDLLIYTNGSGEVFVQNKNGIHGNDTIRISATFHQHILVTPSGNAYNFTISNVNGLPAFKTISRR